MKLKRAIVFGLLFLTACALVPVQDPEPTPASLGAYTLENNSCGSLFVGTGACIFTQGQVVTGSIQVRVPITNTTSVPASVEFISSDCNVDQKLSGVPGATVSLPVSTFLGNSATKSCAVEIVMNVAWDNQANFTFPVSPIVGQVSILTLPHPLASLSYSNQIVAVDGFGYIEELAGTNDQELVEINSNGSSLGQIILQGCGLADITQTYTNPNPSFKVPAVSADCTLFGTIQLVDQGLSESFAVDIVVNPDAYQKLAPPVLTSPTKGSSAQYVSSVDFGTSAVNGGSFTVPANQPSTYYLRQITTGGRYSISYVNNNTIEWTLP